MLSMAGLVMLKNALAFIAAFFLGVLVLMFVLAYYLSKAEYIDGNENHILVTNSKPQKLILSKGNKSFLYYFDVFVSIVGYQMFYWKIKPHVISAKRGKIILVTSLTILVILFVFISYQAVQIKSEIKEDLSGIHIQELEEMGLEQDCIQKLIEDGRINIKVE